MTVVSERLPSGRVLRRPVAAIWLFAVGALTSCGGGDPQEALPPALLQAAPVELGEPPAWPDRAPAPLDDRLRKEVPASTTGGYTIDPMNREAVKLFFNAVHQGSEGIAPGWTGNIATCSPGTTSAAYQDAALRRVNYFRAMAGVPAAVAFTATFNAKAQQAALMMSANQQLSHFPPNSWLCFTADGSEAASKSNIALGNAGPQAVTIEMFDPGASNSAAGHRRWILYPQTQQMGIGDVAPAAAFPQASALWVFDSNIGAARPTVRDEYVAWPPRGFVPYQVVYPRWSFSFPGADFANAQVTMTENGSPMATVKETVANGFGENTLVWIPGTYTHSVPWRKPTSDTVYQVTLTNVVVGGTPRTFTYTTTVFDPAVASGDPNQLAVSGAATIPVGQASTFNFQGAAGATAYERRQLRLGAYELTDGGEAGTTNFSGSDASLTTTTLVASGATSFHLNHATSTDKWMRIQPQLVVGAASTLTFKSRLGFSTTNEEALVEVSSDGGRTWTAAYRQVGTGGAGELSFSTRQVSLAAYAGRIVQVRFRYGLVGSGSFFTTGLAVGWYLDDIELRNVNSVLSESVAATTTNSSFTALLDATGTYAFQVRPLMFGLAGDFGTLVTVQATPASDNRITTNVMNLLLLN